MKQLMAALLQLQTLEMGDAAESPSVSSTIEKLRGKIPPQILGHYDRMLARGKKAVARVRNDVCRECHVRVAIGVLQVLRHGSDIQLCGNCGRYLVLDEDAAPEPVKPVPAAAPKAKRAPKRLKLVTAEAEVKKAPLKPAKAKKTVAAVAV